MVIVVTVCVALVAITTFFHYETLRVLTFGLPRLRMPARAKLLIVIFVTFSAHALEIFLYAVALYVLSGYLGLGTLGGESHPSLSVALYASAETYTSLGYGDIVPEGELRLLAGTETLNGLLLIGWSASYIFIAMERFWSGEGESVVAEAPPAARRKRKRVER